MLRFQCVFDISVEFLVTPRCFRCVEVATANNVAVSGLEIQGAGDIFKVAERKIL